MVYGRGQYGRTDMESPKLLNARSVFTVVALLAGAGLITYGAWLFSHPAGFVSAGLFLLAEGLNEVRR